MPIVASAVAGGGDATYYDGETAIMEMTLIIQTILQMEKYLQAQPYS